MLMVRGNRYVIGDVITAGGHIALHDSGEPHKPIPPLILLPTSIWRDKSVPGNQVSPRHFFGRPT